MPVSSRLVVILCRVTAGVLIRSHIRIRSVAFVCAPSSAEQRPRKYGAYSDRGEAIKMQADKHSSLSLRTDPNPQCDFSRWGRGLTSAQEFR